MLKGAEVIRGTEQLNQPATKGQGWDGADRECPSGIRIKKKIRFQNG